MDIKQASPHNAFGANVGVIVGQDGILCGSGRPDERQAGPGAHHRYPGRLYNPIKYLVNTHYHLDHSLGNCAFVQQGTVVSATPCTATRPAIAVRSCSSAPPPPA